jgi:hypothetical protein
VPLLPQYPASAYWSWLSASQVAQLAAAVHCMSRPRPRLGIEWLAKFGCALVPLVPPSRAVLEPDHVAVYLVAPDGWKFEIHR